MKIYVLASKNTLKTVRYFAIALLLFIVLFWGKELIRTRDYKKITAEIIRVETMVDDGMKNVFREQMGYQYDKMYGNSTSSLSNYNRSTGFNKTYQIEN